MNELAYNLESFNPAFTAVLLKVELAVLPGSSLIVTEACKSKWPRLLLQWTEAWIIKLLACSLYKNMLLVQKDT